MTSGNCVLELGFPLRVGPRAEDVDQRPAGVAGRVDDAAEALAMRVLDDHAVRRREIDLEEGVAPLRVGDGDRQAVVVEPARERPVLDEELDRERGART